MQRVDPVLRGSDGIGNDVSMYVKCYHLGSLFVALEELGWETRITPDKNMNRFP